MRDSIVDKNINNIKKRFAAMKNIKTFSLKKSYELFYQTVKHYKSDFEIQALILACKIAGPVAAVMLMSCLIAHTLCIHRN